MFIKQHGQETAERYLLHEVIESAKAARQYQEHCATLGYAPLDDAEIEEINEARDQLITRFGAGFGGDYGWAVSATGKKRPTFVDIEAAVDLGHYRPWYKLSSHSVHAGPKGAKYNLGVFPGTDVLLGGPSDAGLADPGHSTALSLLQVTTALLNHNVRYEDLVVLSALLLLVDEIGEAFLRAHRRMEERAQRDDGQA